MALLGLAQRPREVLDAHAGTGRHGGVVLVAAVKEKEDGADVTNTNLRQRWAI